MTETVSLEKFKQLVHLTMALTELRAKYCNHLCIENYAPELLEKLLQATRKGEWG